MKQLAAALIFFHTPAPVAGRAGSGRLLPAGGGLLVATGWLTAAVTAGVLYGAAFLLPVPAAVLAAVIARVLLTGALHEDGLSDFLDGFGGGRTREQTLAIMKDSRTGSYGIIGLILYFGLLVALLASLPVPVACAAVLCGDPFCKFVASMTINFLPYARPAAQSKSGVVYAPMRVGEIVCGAAFGVLPMLSLFYPPYWLAGLAPFACIAWLIRQMRRRIGGYTGIAAVRHSCCARARFMWLWSFYTDIMEAVLVRHTSVDVPPGVCYGRTDVPLKATFPQEATAVAAALPTPPFDAVYTSPLSRCERLAAFCGWPDAVRESCLLEMDFGAWEMRPWMAISDPRLKVWFADWMHAPTAGGESFDGMCGRVGSFIGRLKAAGLSRVLFLRTAG